MIMFKNKGKELEKRCYPRRFAKKCPDEQRDNSKKTLSACLEKGQRRKKRTQRTILESPALAVGTQLKPARDGRWVASAVLRCFQLPAEAGRPAVHTCLLYTSPSPRDRC